MEFLSRPLFQESVTYDVWKGKQICYKMHDLMHDLAILVAGIKCAIVISNEDYVDKRTRHMSLGFHSNSLRKMQDSLVQARRMRTLISLRTYSFSPKDKERTLSPMICNSAFITSNLKFLCILDLSATGIKVIPNSITPKRLRYLDLSCNDISKFHHQASKFAYLISM